MARTTTTTYTCDGCGSEVPRKELRKFNMIGCKISGHDWTYGGWSELCAGCESDLLKATSRFFDHDDGQFAELARPE